MPDPVPLVLVAPCLGVLGLVVGSVLTVVVRRVPLGLPVARPPSTCPRCDHPIRARDAVPVLSWVLLRGRCRDCHAPIAVRYPLVEGTTAAAFAALPLVTGVTWVLPALLYLTAAGIALTLIDLDVHRLPDAIVLPAYPVLGALLALASWSPGGTADRDALVRAGIGGAALLAFHALVRVIHPAGMGPGDVKLSGVLGMALAWFGWAPLVVGACAAFLLGGLLAVGLVLGGRRRAQIPFGPWMLAGAAVGVVAGEQVGAWYPGATG